MAANVSTNEREVWEAWKEVFIDLLVTPLVLIFVCVVVSPSIRKHPEFSPLFLKCLGLVIAIKYAKYMIRIALRMAKVDVKNLILSPSEMAVGRIIGYIERFLAFCFVLDGADNAIAMLIAAKGVYRLHELGVGKKPTKPNPSEAELIEAERLAEQKTYYIMIGTFTSIAFAITVAFATRYALGFMK